MILFDATHLFYHFICTYVGVCLQSVQGRVPRLRFDHSVPLSDPKLRYSQSWRINALNSLNELKTGNATRHTLLLFIVLSRSNVVLKIPHCPNTIRTIPISNRHETDMCLCQNFDLEKNATMRITRAMSNSKV